MTMILLPIRLVLGVTKLSAVVGYRLGRIAGYRRLTVLALGVTIGLLVAPVPGGELRARLRRRWEEWTGLVPAPDTAPVPPTAPGPPSPTVAPRAAPDPPGTSPGTASAP